MYLIRLLLNQKEIIMNYKIMFERAKSDLKDSDTFKAQILYYNL